MPSIDSQEGALSLSLAIVFATIAGILIFWIIFVYVYELATKPRKFAFLIICVIFSILRIVHFISYICLNQPEDRIGTTTVFKTVGVCTFYLAFLLVLFIWTKAASPTKKIPFLPFLIGYILFFVVMMALLIAFEVLIFTHQALSPSSDYIIQDQQVIDSTDSSGDIYDAMLAISAFCSTIIALAFLVNTILIVRVTQNVSNWKFYRLFMSCSILVLCFLTRSGYIIYQIVENNHSTAGGFFAIEYYIGEVAPLLVILSAFIVDQCYIYYSRITSSLESTNKSKGHQSEPSQNSPPSS